MIGFMQEFAVDVDVIVPNRNGLSGQADDALDKVFVRLECRNGAKDDDVPAAWGADEVVKFIDQDIFAVLKVGKH